MTHSLTAQLPVSDRNIESKAAIATNKRTLTLGILITGAIAAAMVMVASGWLALEQFSSHTLAFGSSAMTGVLAMLWLSVRGWDFPSSANWPWIGITSVLATLLLPFATLNAVTELSLGWALLSLVVALTVYQLGSQLLLFRRTDAMVAWQFVVSLPLCALLFGHSLGVDAAAIDGVHSASGIDAVAMALTGIAHAVIWQCVWARSRRRTARA